MDTAMSKKNCSKVEGITVLELIKSWRRGFMWQSRLNYKDPFETI